MNINFACYFFVCMNVCLCTHHVQYYFMHATIVYMHVCIQFICFSNDYIFIRGLPVFLIVLNYLGVQIFHIKRNGLEHFLLFSCVGILFK